MNILSISVEFLRSWKEDNSEYGIVTVYKNNAFQFVCGDTFNDSEARVFCKQLGYQYFKTLKKAFFGQLYPSRLYYHYQYKLEWPYSGVPARSRVLSGNCAGDENSILDCQMNVGGCNNYLNNYASVFCSKDPIVRGNSMYA